jgi:hypothetical protein
MLPARAEPLAPSVPRVLPQQELPVWLQPEQQELSPDASPQMRDALVQWAWPPTAELRAAEPPAHAAFRGSP